MRKTLFLVLLGLLVALLTACGTTGATGNDDDSGGSCEAVELQGLWNMDVSPEGPDPIRAYVVDFDQTGNSLSGSVDHGLDEDIGTVSGTIDGCDVSLDVDFTAAGHPDLEVEVTSNLIGTAFGGDYTTTDGETGTVGMTKRNIPGE